MASSMPPNGTQLDNGAPISPWMKEHVVHITRQMEGAAQFAVEDFFTLMTIPTMQSGLAIWQRRMKKLAADAETNLRATTELFRLTDPTAFFETQQWFVGACRDAALARSQDMFRAASHMFNGEPLVLADASPACVADVMYGGARVASLGDTVQQAAKIMREENSGTIAVAEDDRIVGIVTGHDIAVRMVAEARDPAITKVSEVMTPEKRYVFEDVRLAEAATNMIEQKVSSLPVVSRKKRLVGMVSLADLATSEGRKIVQATRKMNGTSNQATLHAS